MNNVNIIGNLVKDVEYYEFDGDYTAQELEDILSRMKNGHEIHLMNVIGKVEKI